MSFSCADNERCNDALVALAEGKYDSLAAAYAGRRFENETAQEFAGQGFLRRFELMKHCILSSMEPFPPRISWAPIRFNIFDATIHLQAFVLNTRGCIDNLAHAWVLEKGLTAEDDAPLTGSDVRFGPATRSCSPRSRLYSRAT